MKFQLIAARGTPKIIKKGSVKNKYGEDIFFVEVNSLEELQKLAIEAETPLIIDFNDSFSDIPEVNYTITIYNDYIE